MHTTNCLKLNALHRVDSNLHLGNTFFEAGSIGPNNVLCESCLYFGTRGCFGKGAGDGARGAQFF